jgi:hypothetical protein
MSNAKNLGTSFASEEIPLEKIRQQNMSAMTVLFCQFQTRDLRPYSG